MKNININVESYDGNMFAKHNTVTMATNNVENHLNIYISTPEGKMDVCLPALQAKVMVRRLAVAYGFIPDETTVTRAVIIDADGNFIRFSNSLTEEDFL